tara:strand:+ start:329 stop:502 length:174 start_codon:yes stop_codon:yes gene_type:complete
VYSDKYQIRLPFEVLADIREMEEKPKAKAIKKIPTPKVKKRIKEILLEADMIANPIN